MAFHLPFFRSKSPPPSASARGGGGIYHPWWVKVARFFNGNPLQRVGQQRIASRSRIARKHAPSIKDSHPILTNALIIAIAGSAIQGVPVIQSNQLSEQSSIRAKNPFGVGLHEGLDDCEVGELNKPKPIIVDTHSRLSQHAALAAFFQSKANLNSSQAEALARAVETDVRLQETMIAFLQRGFEADVKAAGGVAKELADWGPFGRLHAPSLRALRETASHDAGIITTEELAQSADQLEDGFMSSVPLTEDNHDGKLYLHRGAYANGQTQTIVRIESGIVQRVMVSHEAVPNKERPLGYVADPEIVKRLVANTTVAQQNRFIAPAQHDFSSRTFSS